VEKDGKLDHKAFFGIIDAVVAKFPNIKVKKHFLDDSCTRLLGTTDHSHVTQAVVTTLREVHSTNRHTWSAVCWINGETFIAPQCELDVLDRVGGGDGFASGFFYGLMAGKTGQECCNLGWAHGAMLTTTPGDTTMVTLKEVEAFAQGGSARIQR